jgi:hypothetical protein
VGCFGVGAPQHTNSLTQKPSCLSKCRGPDTLDTLHTVVTDEGHRERVTRSSDSAPRPYRDSARARCRVPVAAASGVAVLRRHREADPDSGSGHNGGTGPVDQPCEKGGGPWLRPRRRQPATPTADGIIPRELCEPLSYRGPENAEVCHHQKRRRDEWLAERGIDARQDFPLYFRSITASRKHHGVMAKRQLILPSVADG